MKAIPHRMSTNRSRVKTFFFLIVAILLLIVGLPKLPPIDGTAGGWFTAAWLVLSLLIIGANLYSAIGVSQETTGNVRRLKRSELARMRAVTSHYQDRQVEHP